MKTELLKQKQTNVAAVTRELRVHLGSEREEAKDIRKIGLEMK